MAQIKVHPQPEYTFDQSQHLHVPQLPTGMLVVAPSGGGKTVLITSLLLDIFRKKWKQLLPAHLRLPAQSRAGPHLGVREDFSAQGHEGP